MSLFDDLFADMAVPALVDQFGYATQVSLYQAGGTLDGTYTVLLGPEYGDEDDDGNSRDFVRNMTIPRTADMPQWARTPNLGWTITVVEDGETLSYAIERLLSRSAVEVTIKLKRVAGIRRGQSGVRRR